MATVSMQTAHRLSAICHPNFIEIRSRVRRPDPTNYYILNAKNSAQMRLAEYFSAG